MFLNMVVQLLALLRKLTLNVEDFCFKTIGGVKKSCFGPLNTEKWAISMLQTKDKGFLKQLQPKSQNRHFHTPAANSVLLQK